MQHRCEHSLQVELAELPTHQVICPRSQPTLRGRRKRRKEPIHVRLRHGSRGLDEEVGQKPRGVERLVPVDCPRVVLVEPHLHDDGPDVDPEVKHHDGEQPELGPPALADALHVKKETEREASDASNPRSVTGGSRR